MDPATGLKVLPHWVAQPYTRPLLDVTGKKLPNKNVAQTGNLSIAEGTLSLRRIQTIPLLNLRDAGTQTVVFREEDVMQETSGGKRAPSERTPEPDIVPKRAKLVESTG